MKKLYEVDEDVLDLLLYQYHRIYLDEYPEQKKLRTDYFKPEPNFYSRWLKKK